MAKYQGNSTGDMSVKVKDYQPGQKQFAGSMMGKANDYMERTAYKGRYD